MSIMTSAATVYAGPSLSGAYPSIGQIQKDRVVTAIFTENGFAFVEFTPPNTNRKTRGYVERGKIFINEEVDIFAAESKTRYVREAVSTFYGPSYNYNAGDQLQADKMVSYLGRKEQNYAFIEYSTGVNFKRAYVNSNYLSMPLEDRLDQILADLNNAGYKSLNKYSHGQCTWYCWGRAYEKCGRSLTFSGSSNGNQWYNNVSGGYSSKRTAAQGPIKNSVCSCNSSDPNGHVLFIEGVQNGYVYFTEANWDEPDGKLKRLPLSSFASTRNVIGYIVL